MASNGGGSSPPCKIQSPFHYRFLVKIWISAGGNLIFAFGCSRVFAGCSPVEPAPGHQFLPYQFHAPVWGTAPPRVRQPLSLVPLPRGIRDAAASWPPHSVGRRGRRRPAAAPELDWPVPADALHPHVHRRHPAVLRCRRRRD
jgi:hypothetical protein